MSQEIIESTIYIKETLLNGVVGGNAELHWDMQGLEGLASINLRQLSSDACLAQVEDLLDLQVPRARLLGSGGSE